MNVKSCRQDRLSLHFCYNTMQMAKLLIAEDDESVRKWLTEALALEGHVVTAATDGESALRLLPTIRHDLVILDVTMPGLSGIEVCRAIRRSDDTIPIIFLTARDTEDDKLTGFDAGADDYVTKPFSLRELFARITALLRRSSKGIVSDTEIDGIVFSPGKMSLKDRNGHETPLTDKETSLLSALLAHRGEVLGRDWLLNKVWGIGYFGTTRTLDQHVAMLRRKLSDSSVRIESIRNVGYRLEAT